MLLNDFNAFQHNPTEYAKQINVPTLLAYGEKDGRVSRQEIDHIFKNLNGQKQLVLFEKSGHEDYLVNSNEKWLNKISHFMNEE